MLIQSDSLEFIKKQDNYSNDILYCDPPYALGSEVIIRADGKVDYKNASDFMNKWEMPTGVYWEEWFKEAYRTLKHGGYLIMFGMDRQLLLFKYYAQLAGFQEQQLGGPQVVSQPDSATLMIRLIMMLAPLIFMGIGIFISFKYKIDAQKQKEINDMIQNNQIDTQGLIASL